MDIQAACEMFGARSVPEYLLPSSNISRKTRKTSPENVPATDMALSDFQTGIPAFKLFQSVGLVKSGGEARRLIEQGGGYLNGDRIETFDQMVTKLDVQNGEIVLRSGKKKFHKILIKSKKTN